MQILASLIGEFYYYLKSRENKIPWKDFRKQHAGYGFEDKFYYTGLNIIVLFIIFLIALTLTIKYFFGIEIIPINEK